MTISQCMTDTRNSLESLGWSQNTSDQANLVIGNPGLRRKAAHDQIITKPIKMNQTLQIPHSLIGGGA